MTRAANLNELTLDHAEQAWHVLAEHLERFVNEWESGGPPPSLTNYLPDGPEALRRLTLVELVKVDLEYRWLHRQMPRPLFEYLEEFPELKTDRVPPDLIYEEIHIRRKAGDQAPVDAYLTRFSDQAPELDRLLAMGDGGGSTVVYHGGPVAGPVEPGETIDDFELLTLLGKGAFASVFLARQKSMSRLVALKVSTDRSCEPQTLAQLDHPGIVRVYDQRVVPERNLRLLYMQFLPGGSLQDVLKTLQRTPPEEWSGRTFLAAVDRELDDRGLSAPESAIRARIATMTWPEVVCWLGSRLAAALSYAAQQGVLHRDVKPANVLLTAEGVPKLVDFNISFCSKVEGASPAAYFGGSLAYMSPEQLEAFNPQHARKPDSLDGRADLYSLASLLWELLTGSRPFGQDR
ncbi:MAG TPA: serine/threonine-protein kinase, partial [Pirellulales bacterium]